MLKIIQLFNILMLNNKKQIFQKFNFFLTFNQHDSTGMLINKNPPGFFIRK